MPFACNLSDGWDGVAAEAPVGARASVDEVWLLGEVTLYKTVVAGAPEERVASHPTFHFVVAGTAESMVVPRRATGLIVAAAEPHRVAPASALEAVTPVIAVQDSQRVVNSAHRG